MTRAYSGRPARALANAFTTATQAQQVPGYPQVHHLTGPLRAAARAADDADVLHLWAGTGVAEVVPGPAAQIVARLTG